jgi:hypothetical protein
MATQVARFPPSLCRQRQKYRREQPDEIVEAIETDDELDSNERDRSRDGRRDRSRDKARDRDRPSPSYEPERGDEGRDDANFLGWLPSTGIDYDVICKEILRGQSRANHRGIL